MPEPDPEPEPEPDPEPEPEPEITFSGAFGYAVYDDATIPTYTFPTSAEAWGGFTK